MKPQHKKRFVVGGLAAALLVVIGARLIRPAKPPRVQELDGAVITALDPQARTAEIEFIHPRSGQKTRLASDIPADCQIFIEDRPAALADLYVGQIVDVRGLVRQTYFDVTVEPQWVRAHDHPAGS